MKDNIAICPGSFDPITIGHLDIISRSAKMFSKVIVVVMSNVHKNGGSFTVEERVEMIRKSVADIPNDHQNAARPLPLHLRQFSITFFGRKE